MRHFSIDTTLAGAGAEYFAIDIDTMKSASKERTLSRADHLLSGRAQADDQRADVACELNLPLQQ
jgi:hypothetical protein